jgi:hypothetical protein
VAATASMTTRPEQMRSLLNDVIHDLVMIDLDGGDGLVALPILYPGGAPVVIRVRRDDDQFIVNDQGNGYVAAEHMGGASTYLKLAPAVAAMNGVEFDGHMMFAARVTREWLPSTIIFAAAASRQAVERTAEKMTVDLEQSLRANLQDRLRHTFRDRVSLDVEIAGGSTKKRKFAARIDAGDHVSVFDLVTPHHVSINGAIVKFQDIAQLDAPVSGVAVLSDQNKVDTGDIALLSQWASKIIPLNANDATLREAA